VCSKEAKGQKAIMRAHPGGLWVNVSLEIAISFISALSAATFAITRYFRVWKL
jgi:hypothetical protein